MYIGEDENEFLKYNQSKWRNNNTNPSIVSCCGPISTSIMIAYYQDHHPDLIQLDESIRQVNSTSPGKLIQLVKEFTPFANKTLPFHVRKGVQRFLDQYNQSTYRIKVKKKYLTWKHAKRKIDEGYVVAVGLNFLTSKKYGNHWVTAYGYTIEDGKKYYICIDNWGNHHVKIPVRSTLGLIYLEN